MAGFAPPFLTISHLSRRKPMPRGGAFSRLWALVRLWRRRTRERNELIGLDPRALRDIGVFASDAEREAAKWFWRE